MSTINSNGYSLIIKQIVLQLVDQIMKKIIKNKDFEFIFIRQYFNNKTEKEIVTNVQKFILPYKKMIESKNKQFFIENDFIFNSLPQNKVMEYKELFKNISEKDETCLWKYFEMLVFYSEKLY